MKLLCFLFKTEEHQKLAKLLWADGLVASIHELSQMSGLPYATAYELLHKMEDMGLVKMEKQGRATLFCSNVANEELKPLLALMGNTAQKKKSLADFEQMDLPLVGEFPELYKEKAQYLEELLVKAVVLSKRNPTLLRVLPLLVKRLGVNLNSQQLVYWSKKYHVDRELGFVLELTAELSKEKKFNSLAKKLKDRRWSKVTAFLEDESNLSGFQAQLVAQNTPALAKKWFLMLNMGFDSFKSHYMKFA